MEILNNPFHTLGVNIRDNKSTIVDISEEKALVDDEMIVEKALSILINPKKRISAEIGWLPGLGPKKADTAIEELKNSPSSIFNMKSAPPLSMANLLVDAFNKEITNLSENEASEWVILIAELYDECQVEEIKNLLNEERSISGFPEISKSDDILDVLKERGDYYRRSILNALEKLEFDLYVNIITLAADTSTNYGLKQGTVLIANIVDSYETTVQDFFDKENTKIENIVNEITDLVETDYQDTILIKKIDNLENVVKKWDLKAQPIQLIARSRGTEHEISNEIYGLIRNLTLNLTNEHDLFEISKRLTILQQEVFAEDDRILERTEEDIDSLDDLLKIKTERLEDAEKDEEKFRKNITYSAKIGRIFQDTLSISPEGIHWKGKFTKLGDITSIKYGATRHSLNGIPTGTTFTATFNEGRRVTKIEHNKKDIHGNFVNSLMNSVGIRLLTEMINGLRDGKEYRFGELKLTDTGVELNRKFFLSKERVFCIWDEISLGHGARTYYLCKSDEEKKFQFNFLILKLKMFIYLKQHYLFYGIKQELEN